MHVLIALFLFGHGLAHLVGFVTSWRLVKLEETPYTTRILGGLIDIGRTGTRLVGLLWLAAGTAFIAVGIGVILLKPWWRPYAISLSFASLGLCILGLPETKFGIVANIFIIAFMFIGHSQGWLPNVRF